MRIGLRRTVSGGVTAVTTAISLLCVHTIRYKCPPRTLGECQELESIGRTLTAALGRTAHLLDLFADEGN